MTEILNVLTGRYRVCQKMNYLRYAMSGRENVLGYKPVVLSIVATTKCTLSCDMCPTHSKAVPAGYRWRQTGTRDMDFALFKKAVDLFREALSVHIIGSGEPLLNLDFYRMVEYASRERRMETKTFSNGTTIGENTERLLTSRLDGITVSVNGHNAGEFTRLTGMDGGVFEKICRDTKTLAAEKKRRKRPLSVKLSFIVDRENFKAVPQMVELAQEIGADRVFLCNFLPCPYGDLTPRKRVINFDDDEIASFLREYSRGMPRHLRGKIEFPALINSRMAENKCDVHFRQV
ncbi:MAG: radical SAM protein, partial [Candidatus Omnitrophota bacterium]